MDSIKEITYITEDEDGSNPMEGKEFKNKYVKKVARVKDSLVNIVDVERLLADLEDYFKEVDVEY